MLTGAAGQVARAPRLRRAGLRMVIGSLFATAAKGAGKGLIARTRPTELAETGAHRFTVPGEDDKGQQSFPSGHTAGAVAACAPVAIAFPRAGAALAGAGMGLLALKLVRGDHYVSDIVAGAAVGAVSAAAAASLVGGAAGTRIANSAPPRWRRALRRL